VSYSEILEDKIAMYIRVTLHWGYLIVLWLFHLCISCTVFVLSCIVVVLTCFVMCRCVCMCGCCNAWMFWQLCGCFGNMCTCIYCVFVLFRLCIFILICTSVRTTATGDNSFAVSSSSSSNNNNNNNNNNEYPEILGATVGNLVATANWRPVFVQACFN
jgi:hypothetical protein